MKPHDYEYLNDAQCLHVDHFAEKLDLWCLRNLGDATCWCADAQRRFPLEDKEVARVDEYIAARFQRYPPEPRPPEGMPVPVLAVR